MDLVETKGLNYTDYVMSTTKLFNDFLSDLKSVQKVYIATSFNFPIQKKSHR